MWVMTTHGMVSIVADEVKPGTLQVRAREKRALKHFLPGWKILTTKQADYEFRCVGVAAGEVCRCLLVQVSKIDYPNFKKAAKGADYIQRLHRAWYDMGGDTMSYGGR